jgi:hypothetical protein
MTEQSQQYRWQIAQKAAGNCIICAKPRGKDGTKRHCRFHADRHSQQNRKSFLKMKKDR